MRMKCLRLNDVSLHGDLCVHDLEVRVETVSCLRAGSQAPGLTLASLLVSLAPVQELAAGNMQQLHYVCECQSSDWLGIPTE